MQQTNFIAKSELFLPPTMEKWNRDIDHLTSLEDNHLPFILMRAILLDKLQKEAAAEQFEQETIPDENISDSTGVISGKRGHVAFQEAASNAGPYIPYDSVRRATPDKKTDVYTKSECTSTALPESYPAFPEPKPYPVLDSQLAREPEMSCATSCPDFKNEFALYAAGKLPLTFLYLFWGKNLGTFFKQTLFDILSYYRSFGAIIFKRAINAMLVSLKVPKNGMPVDAVDKDMRVLAELSCLL